MKKHPSFIQSLSISFLILPIRGHIAVDLQSRYIASFLARAKFLNPKYAVKTVEMDP